METSLGGKFLYVGNLDESVRPLIAAANIGGAATLVLSAEQLTVRQAQREGLIDFLVNSLDEALRIFKNEIRKRQPVAVAVSGQIQTIEAEMLERGVLPDLLPSSFGQSRLLATYLSQGAKELSSTESLTGDKLHIWRVPTEYAQQTAVFDSILAEHLATDDLFNRRWLRLSPRYLGIEARQLRSLACDDAALAKLAERIGPPLPVDAA